MSLLLGNPARAREVASGVPPEDEQHATALVLRAQAELQLGDLDLAVPLDPEVAARLETLRIELVSVAEL